MGLGGFLFSGTAVIDTDLPDKKNILGNLFLHPFSFFF